MLGLHNPMVSSIHYPPQKKTEDSKYAGVKIYNDCRMTFSPYSLFLFTNRRQFSLK